MKDPGVILLTSLFYSIQCLTGMFHDFDPTT